jgi:hypothetical protein
MISVLLLVTSLCATPDPRKNMDVLSARPTNCEVRGTIERAHLKINLYSKGFNTAAVATGTRHRQSLGKYIYQIRQLMLVDIVAGNKPSYSGIRFP